MNQAALLSARLSSDYNCAHFVSDAWEHETGMDIRPILTGFLAVRGERRITPHVRGGLVRIPAPSDPCVVLIRRDKATPHVGMFTRGRVLHLTDSGPMRQLLSVARLGYHSVRFYALRSSDN